MSSRLTSLSHGIQAARATLPVGKPAAFPLILPVVLSAARLGPGERASVQWVSGAKDPLLSSRSIHLPENGWPIHAKDEWEPLSRSGD